MSSQREAWPTGHGKSHCELDAQKHESHSDVTSRGTQAPLMPGGRFLLPVPCCHPAARSYATARPWLRSPLSAAVSSGSCRSLTAYSGGKAFLNDRTSEKNHRERHATFSAARDNRGTPATPLHSGRRSEAASGTARPSVTLGVEAVLSGGPVCTSLSIRLRHLR